MQNLGILVSTHVGHKRFLKASLSCLRTVNPKVLVCSYNTNRGYLGHPTIIPILPDNDVMELANYWILSAIDKMVASWGELHLAGLSLLSNLGVEYVYATEGDCVITKPDGLRILCERLIKENGDVICAESNGPKHAATISYFARIDVMHKILKSYIEHMYDAELLGCSPEGHLGAEIYRLNINNLPVASPDHSHFSYGYRGTWGDILGFIHLHATEKWRIGHHHHPLLKEFYDTRHLPPIELAALEKYWTTGSTEHLVTDGYWPIEKIDNEQKELLSI